MASLLVENGADVNITDRFGHHPISDAINSRNIDIIKHQVLPIIYRFY